MRFLRFKRSLRRGRLRCSSMWVAAGLLTQPAAAAYPEHTVKVIVGFAPGGTNDILARIIAGRLQDKLKQLFIVENRAGANSIIAADFVAKSAADGYTIFVASSGARSTRACTARCRTT